ncbi:MAG: histidinol-phosphate transaminase [Candidatus Nezhaarchaeota archaeon]|nr:histidinol-phosphate transaminase [Candidatus Nezhaarchaeota archaeon]MCX8141311.1 histidinol-phosphate transaminase [Candidatus Nezhaarchaeota archaeon]MDW8049577.1 histidinol-phosphate transaminase [Nitrososphaerota archaeon]
MSIEAYVNPYVKKLKRYEVKETTLKPLEAYKLDANENFVLDEEWIRGVVEKAIKKVDVRLYPPAYAMKAVNAIADFLGLSRDNIIVDNGSDAIIDLIAKCFVGRGRAVIVEPTFEMYRFYVEAIGGIAESFNMSSNFTIDVEDLLVKAREAKAIFIASPNNPTGTQHPRDVIETVIEGFKGVVVIDEAYSDFGDFNLKDLPLKYENAIILRSFSKVAGLAGLRIGYAIVNKAVHNFISNLQSPYSVNSIAQEVVCFILENWTIVKEAVEKIKAERARVFRELLSIKGVRPYDSRANFILFKVEGMSSAELTEKLALKGFYVRERSADPILKNCIRVTIGPKDVNDKFLSALSEILES